MKPYYETELGKLYHGDCLEIISRLPPVELSITSPPYNLKKPPINKENNNLKFAKYLHSDNKGHYDYLSLLRESIAVLISISDRYVFYNIQMVSGNKRALFETMGYYSKYLKEVVVWDKLSGEPALEPGVLNSAFEFVLIFSGPMKPQKRKFYDVDFHGSVDNVLRYGRGLKSVSEYHGAIMPKFLPLWIINTFSKNGDGIILDPFLGTGTTAVVCEELNRKWIGIEIEERYCEIAAKRIENERKQLKLF